MLELNEINNPFPGIRPFEMDETNLFFGRDGQSDELLKRMQHSRLLAVVGTSGSGKSSLIRAGLLPALYGGLMGDAGSSWRIAIHRPGGDPIGNLALALADPLVFGSESDAEIQTTLIETTLRRSSIGLIDVARQARMPEHENLLVVVDQFEELFRFKQAQSGDDATAFVKLLLEASAQREIPIYIIITMRSDFLGDCSQFTGLPEAINDGQYLIPRMSRDERKSAIVGPIAVGEGQISAPLVSRLLNDVGDNPDQLPILQHALMRTWSYWTGHRRNGNPIDLEDYTAIGTMTEALSQHADEAFNELPDERSRLIAEKLFKRLTEKGTDNREIRRPTPLAELCAVCAASEAEVSAVIEVFRGRGRSFLMPPVGAKLTSETVVDISHESLIRNWTRLQKWVDEEAQSSRIYRRLAEAAALHREGSEGLLQDPGLQIALDWFEKNKPNTAWAQRYYPEFDEAKKYLTESCEAREAAERERERQRNAELDRERREREQAQLYADQQRRAARRLRWLTAGMAVMFLLALATAASAIVSRHNARSSAEAAIKAHETAEGLRQSAETSAKNLQAALDSLQQEKTRVDSLAQRLQAEKDKTNEALKSEQTALVLQQEATADAKKQAEIAAVNLKDTQKATTAASSIVRRALPVVSQGDLLLRGSEAYHRGELDNAMKSFTPLLAQLKTFQSGANSQANNSNLTIRELEQFAEDLGKYEQFRLQLGWTHSHIGSVLLQKGDPTNAIGSYQESLEILDKVAESSTDPLKFETYLGLAEAHRQVALKEPLTAEEHFAKSEEYFIRALDFEQGALAHPSWAVADTHLKLARMYVDWGKVDKAEASYKQAVNGRRLGKAGNGLDSLERAGLAATMRELAEFYEGQETRYKDAVQAFNEMITLQENITINDLAQEGQEIANSYTDLGQLYLDKGESQKADDVFRAANLLQRTALKLRRIEKIRNTSNVLAILEDLDNDLNELGDAYVKLGKFRDAEEIYTAALEHRKDRDDENAWKSYDKLSKFYRISLKDYAKAAENAKALVELCRVNPKSDRYADAMIELATVYGDQLASDPAKGAEAESLYKQALEIYTGRDWQSENLILFRLSKLYEKQQRVAEREQILRRRSETLTRYFMQLQDPARPQPRDPVTLVSEYLYATNALAYFYVGRNPAAADAAYLQVMLAHNYIMQNIYNEKVLGFYADTLQDYKNLLLSDKINKPSEAARVASTEKDVREKLHQFDRIREQNIQQIKQTGQTAP